LRDGAGFFELLKMARSSPQLLKPVGEENEHQAIRAVRRRLSPGQIDQDHRGGSERPGYADHCHYDEFGNSWDHVPPPHNRHGNSAFAYDVWGPEPTVPNEHTRRLFSS
jgi:hypothetical protein